MLELGDRLREVFLDFRDDSDLWVAVLAGMGKALGVGADIDALGRRGHIASHSHRGLKFGSLSLLVSMALASVHIWH